MFENIEEMKAHLAQFAQNPTIEIGPVVLCTNGDWMSPRLSIKPSDVYKNEVGYTIDEAQMLLKSLEQELIPYRKWLANPLARQLPMILTIAGTGWAVLTLFTYLSGPAWVRPAQPTPEEVATNSVAIWVILLSVIWSYLGEPVLKMIIGDNTVFHQPRETWWHRHSNELIVGALSAGLTAALGAVATYYLA